MSDAESLIASAQAAADPRALPFVRRTGVLRPALNAKHAADFRGADEAAGCRLLSADAAAEMLPGLRSAGGCALHVGEGVVVQVQLEHTAVSSCRRR